MSVPQSNPAPAAATAVSTPPLKGLVFDIRRQCEQFGPGKRTAVYFKGCPLHCLWCENPESVSRRPEVELDGARCVECGACVEACPRERHVIDEDGHHLRSEVRCISCMRCVAGCQRHAMTPVGKAYRVPELVDELARDADDFASGGGVTLTGGEPLTQGRFLIRLLDAMREYGWHLALDTSGYGATDTLMDAVRRVDLVLFDLKETDAEKHLRWTGAPLQPVLDHLRAIAEGEVEVWLRLPVIAGANDREDHWREVAALATMLRGVTHLWLMPYQPVDAELYRRLGCEPPAEASDFQAPTTERLRAVAEMLAPAHKPVDWLPAHSPAE